MDSTSRIKPVKVGYPSSNSNDAWLSFSWLTTLVMNPELADCKLAIVGILGDSNSGKSFLLNILAEYLRCEEEGTHGWMQNLSKKNTLPGFALHEERKREYFNEGIYMWPCPFVLKKPCDGGKEEKVVVLLLDINMDEINRPMEVLMCLLCSTLIYCKNASECPDISRILSIRNAILTCSNIDTIYNLQPKDVVFQHLMVVFRDFPPPEDSKFKCGKDKSLRYISEVMKKKDNVPWKEEFDKIPTKNCFILKRQDLPVFDHQGLHLKDKDFIKQLKNLTEDLLTIDDLQLKSVKNSLITLKELNNVQRMEFLIPHIVSNYKSTQCIQANLHQPMDTSDGEANVAVQNVNDPYEEVAKETEASKDVEMKDISQSSQNTFEGCSDSQAVFSNEASQAVRQTTLSQEECEKYGNGEFETNNKNAYQNKDLDKEIENILQLATTRFQQIHFTTVSKFSVLKMKDDLVKEVTSKLETTFANYAVPDPAKRLSNLVAGLEMDLNGIEDIFVLPENKGNTEQDVCIFATNENDVINYSEVNKVFSEYLSTAQKNYADEMEKFFSTTEQSEENLKKLHDSVLGGILIDVDRSWKEKMNSTDDIKEKVCFVLQNDFQSYSDRFQKSSKIQETADRLVKIIDKNFTRDCDNFITSGAFIQKQIKDVIEELFKKAVQKLQLSNKDAQEVRQLIRPKVQKCIRRLETLKNIFLEFANESKKFFQMFKFLNDDKFRKLRDKAEKIAEKNKLDAVETGIFQRGLEAILKECKRANVEIIKNEVATLKEIVQPRIKYFYDEEMKKMTQNRKSLPQLKEAHDKLKKECIETVKKSGSYIDFHCIRLQSSFNELDQMLNRALEFHAENNQRKIDKTMAKANLLGKKARNNYIELMNRKIGNQTLSQQQLEQFHRDSYSETSTLLKIELQNLNEDPKPYMNNLESQIKDNFDSFAEDNVKRTETGRRETLKREAMEKKLEKGREESSRLNNSREYNTVPKTPEAQTYEKFNTFEKNQSDANISSKAQRSTESMAIAVEFGMKTVKCGIMKDDGQFTIIPDRWGNVEFSNHVTLTYDDEILIGKESNGRPYGDIKFEKNLTDILKAPSEKLNYSPLPLICFKGEKLQITKEFLCGLILSRVKSDAENFLNASVDSVVITVPLCYTSSQRQATKDAAKIAGFSLIHLINEPTAAALAYANDGIRAQSNNNFLVIVANTDSFLDMAVYEYNSGKVGMASCAGNLHHGTTDFIKSSINWFQNLFGEERRRFISSLIKECVGKREIMEYALICDNGAVYLELQKIANSAGRQAQRPDRSIAILIGATIFAALSKVDDKRARTFVADRLPYRIEYARPDKPGRSKVCERHEKLPKTEKNFSHTIGCYDDLHIQIYESGNEEDFATGILHVPVAYRNMFKRTLQVNHFVSSEGILRITANYTDTNAKEEIKINYNSFNMSEQEVAINASLVSSLVMNPKLEKERRMLETSKRELRSLAELIQSNLNKVESVFGQDQMEKRASAALEAIAHPKITKEDIENKTTVLTKLKTKYLPLL